MLFPGFEQKRVAGEGAEINLRIGGKGPALLLLHGYPQTHAMWHRIAPKLAEDFTVVCADLRGYGDSDKPETTPDHALYAFRAMAADMAKAMATLGFDQFFLAGHDRGARVSHRLTLDHQARVKKVALMDIVPTLHLYENIDQQVATGYYHWFWLIQPAPFPEKMIGSDPEFYLRKKTGHWSGSSFQFDEAAMAEYLRCFAKPETIHASCEDYRAAATIDLVHDRADRDAGKRVTCPMLVLWGSKGLMGKAYDVLGAWRDRVSGSLDGHAVNSGHFLPEEAPDETYAAMLKFFKA